MEVPPTLGRRRPFLETLFRSSLSYGRSVLVVDGGGGCYATMSRPTVKPLSQPSGVVTLVHPDISKVSSCGKVVSAGPTGLFRVVTGVTGSRVNRGQTLLKITTVTVGLFDVPCRLGFEDHKSTELLLKSSSWT